METTQILEGLYQAGYNAHRNTSFDPDKRADNIVQEYTDELLKDLKELPQVDHIQYVYNYRRYLFAWLNAKSRCASTMITGSANFNVRRNEKANNSESNRYSEFREWRERVFKAIKKRIEREKTPEQAWESIKATILDKAQCIIEIDKGINTYTSRQLILSNLSSFIKRIAKNGQTEHVKKSLDLIRQINTDNVKPIITDKSSIWKLEQVAEIKREKQVDTQARENKVHEFEGGKVVVNFKDSRLQIFHDQKPPYEEIQKLKSFAFRWSPFNKCWQRILTNNAMYVVSNLMNIKFTTPLQHA